MDPNLQNAVDEITLANATISSLKAQVADLQAKLAAAQADDAADTAQISSLQSQLQTAQSQLAAAKADDAADEAQIASLTAEVARLQALVDAASPAAVPLLGAAFHSGESLPASVKHLDVHRSYFQPGDFLSTQSWGGSAKIAHDTYGCRVFSISLKPDGGGSVAFTKPDNIKRWCESIPSDVDRANVLLTFYHEHDGNIRDGSLTKALYVAGSKQLADIAHSYGMKYGPIHNGVNKNSAGKWGLWPDVWAANEADVSLYDFWGVDCYSPNYEDPTPRMDPIKTYADSLSLPALIGEMGAPAADPVSQAAWCTKARAWALANTRWAMYWSSQVSSTGSTNWRLSDQAAKNWFGLV